MLFEYVKVEVLIPEEYIVRLRDELNAIGTLTVGNYDHVISYSAVKGYYRPLEEANPYLGQIGKISSGTECKMEFCCLYSRMEDVKTVIKHIHPYEEPVIYFHPVFV
ncbi:cytochrome C biogenesis protein [Cytobacillus sp. Sa5YUA1]|uniref:Cytochrome C biogenesis protein n=1 Tax=Cytobacillus stercorigallinarum TaxID=2762240 RepID=A0ABR8QPR6_9BACI|nr:cytochrome C biogenesis protein [Cytobacillus stercorigallinarum]MBD7937530.1 cytochrome C biogenesis protein [Cytobacillus stercorigallinarum]